MIHFIRTIYYNLDRLLYFRNMLKYVKHRSGLRTLGFSSRHSGALGQTCKLRFRQRSFFSNRQRRMGFARQVCAYFVRLLGFTVTVARLLLYGCCALRKLFLFVFTFYLRIANTQRCRLICALSQRAAAHWEKDLTLNNGLAS